ncbi:MAG: ADP-ribosylglycohydrolase family protein [Acidobacteriia bacterium]|nr:ADP-ribosylglycohydrolase family protein [Terriglobia bacterium]
MNSKLQPYVERAVAGFKALASGDAIGKQTETLSHADVLRLYPEGIQGFHGRPGDVIPRYAGNRRYEWRIGETTDDTEQTLAVGRALLRVQPLSHTIVGEELLKCRKSLHPGVSMWDFHRLGDASGTAVEGDGCGAAMRVAPVGVLYSPERLDELVRAVYESSLPTHGGQFAICAAAAVAGAISGAMEGKPAAEVLNLAIQAARAAEAYRSASKGTAATPNIATLIQEIHADLSRHDTLLVNDLAQKYFPDKNETKVPLAINLALLTESAEQTILLAANVGGDADSVASIGGAIAGALRPDTVNDAWFQVVQTVNGDDLIEMAHGLAQLRSS